MKNKLQEKAVSTSAATKVGLALLIHSTDVVSYTLYDAKIAISALKSYHDNKITTDLLIEQLQDATYAMIQVDPDATKGEAYGASEVVSSASRKGYGPLLYDIAMAGEHGLVSDRGVVSHKARSVWDHYFSRKDVTHKKLDDIEDPKTRPTIDDSELHHEKNSGSLNYAYFLKKSPNIGALVTNNNKVVNFAKTIKLSRPIQELIIIASEYFFQSKL